MPEGEYITPNQPNEGIGSIPALENPAIPPTSNTLQSRGQFLGFDALRNLAQAKRDQIHGNIDSPITSEENLNYVHEFNRGLLRLIPTWVKAPIIAAGLIASYPKDELMNRRKFLKVGGFITAVGTFLAGCGGEPGTGTLNLTSSGEYVSSSEDEIDGLALLEKESWTADELLQYLQFAGIGGVLSYTAADAVLTSNPRNDVISALRAAIDAGENLNYRVAILDLFDAVDNTMPEASQSIVNTQELAKPEQFRSLGLTNPDGSIPQSWAEVKFNRAITGEVTDTRFGGRTMEYISSGEIIEGFDITKPDSKVTFLGETRSSKNVAIRIQDSTGQTAEVLAQRNVMFPNFNKDRGYRLITPDGTAQKIFTHLEARHPISMTDVSNFMGGIGPNAEVDYLIKCAGERGPVVMGVRTLHDNRVHDVVFKMDPRINQLLAEDKIDDVIEYARALPEDRIITAYDSFDRINGLSDEVLEVHKRYRNVFSLQKNTMVYETLPNGDYLRLPSRGPGIIRWAAQLGKLTRGNPRMGQKIGKVLEVISKNRPKLKATASVVGAVLEVLAIETAKVALDVYEAGTTYDRLNERANLYNEFGTGDGPIAPYSLDRYKQNFTLTTTPSTFADANGQIVTGKAAILPPLKGLPTSEGATLAGITFERVKPTNEIPEDASLLDLSTLKTQIELNQIRMGVANHPFNRGIESLNFLYARQNTYNEPYQIGFPALPTEYGELPKRIGIFLDGEVMKFCTVDYANETGLGENLGTEFAYPVEVTHPRDLVAYYGSYQETLKHITAADIDGRSGNFVVKYSIINNNQVNIQVTPA